jgi:hypothetical protein
MSRGQGTTIADLFTSPMVTSQYLSAICDIDQMDSVTGGPNSSVILLGGSLKTSNGLSLIRIRGLAARGGRRAIVRVVPSAKDLWVDQGMILGTIPNWPTSPPFEGPALKAPTAVDTSAAVQPREVRRIPWSRP